MAWVLFFEILLVGLAGAAIWGTFRGVRDSLESIDKQFDVVNQDHIEADKGHAGRIDDALRQIEELQALMNKQDKWVLVTNVRLDTLEAYVHQPSKPAEPPRRVLQPKTFSEFKQIVENGVDE